MWIEPSDVVAFILAGDIHEAEMHAILAFARRLSEGDVYTVIDLSRVGTVSPEARRVVRETPAHPTLRSVAVVGASFHLRVLATLIMKALAMVAKRSFDLAFFRSDDEARAWIADLRQKRGGGGTW